MAGAVWTIRGVDEDVRKMAAEAAKARRLTLREWIEEAVRAHAPAPVQKAEHPEPDQLDLVTWIDKVRELDSRVAVLEAAEARPGSHDSASTGKVPKPRQNTSSTGSDSKRVTKLRPDQEAAARLLADIQASGVELFTPGPSGDPAGRRLTEAGEDAVRRLYAVLQSQSGVTRLLGANRATVKRVIEKQAS